MKGFRKWAYIAFMGSLTCSALSACYWQGRKYVLSTARWDSIREELSKEYPAHLANAREQELYPFKYLMVEGKLSEEHERVERRKQNRMGYLVVRALRYKDSQGKLQEMAALQGWCEEQFTYRPKEAIQKEATLRGILRERQKKDFVHEHFKKEDLQKYHMNTYINLDEILPRLHITPNQLNQKYYFEILRPLTETDHESFPYQYTVDNFELPYLTPDKHLSYATFWGCCSILGLSTIFRVLRFK